MQREGAGHAGRNRRSATVFALDSGGVISQAHATARRPRAGITVAQPCIEETHYGLSFAFLPKRTAEICVDARLWASCSSPVTVFSFSAPLAPLPSCCPARLAALSFNCPRRCVAESSFKDHEHACGCSHQLASSSPGLPWMRASEPAPLPSYTIIREVDKCKRCVSLEHERKSPGTVVADSVAGKVRRWRERSPASSAHATALAPEQNLLSARSISELASSGQASSRTLRHCHR